MGYFWLAATEYRFNPLGGNLYRQAGYGFFLGYAALQGIVLASNTVLEGDTFWPVLTLLVSFTAAGGVLFARGRKRIRAARSYAKPATNPAPTVDKALCYLFVVWAALHLMFIAVEILYRPVFPWDAWLNWMYRAKAWYAAGHLFYLDHPNDWLSGSGQAQYNVVGNHYPTFVPVIAFWTASALGRWSETLVNLPVLGCGVALGLGLYGQCREYGLRRGRSALFAYLLLSIPLVGAHLSLAGQSDIWMAGFTGLGFVALLHGAIQNKPSQILLGLAMTALATAIKLEGTVWLFGALLTISLVRYPRAALSTLAVAVTLAALGWYWGITYLDIPLLGGLGVFDGQVHIPLLGAYTLQTFELWDDYWNNFFISGTWHLLWLYTALGALSLTLLPAGRVRRTILVFYAVLVLAQWFIFEVTESGQWAQDWTAINRLPLHFAPALIFALAALVQSLVQRDHLIKTGKSALVIPITSLLLAVCGAIVYLFLAYPPVDGGKPQIFAAQQMKIVVGSGRQTDPTITIDQYQNNVAILSSGPIHLDAARLPLVQVATAGDNRNRAAFFWRNGRGPNDLHSIEISGRGTRWINLGDAPEWRGTVTEIGLIFYADGERSVVFRSLNLVPAGLQPHLNKLAQDWLETPTWSQVSVNWVRAGAEASAVSLPALMSAWVLVALFLAITLSRRLPGAWPSAALCLVAAWVVLDTRWTANSLVQLADTTRAYPMESATYLEFGDDRLTRQLVDSARPEIELAGKRTVIMADEPGMQFQILRAKYLALPASTYVHEGPVETVPTQFADYVLVLRKRYTGPGHTPATAAQYADIINQRGGPQATVISETDDGFLLSIAPARAPLSPANGN